MNLGKILLLHPSTKDADDVNVLPFILFLFAPRQERITKDTYALSLSVYLDAK